jgi:hypothetical protein
MIQYFFNDKYFNLRSDGLSSTTWTWEGLSHIAFNDNVDQLDWTINVKTKIAREFRLVENKDLSKKLGHKVLLLEYTGRTSQLV